MDGLAIGIDLGTTNSCVAVWKDGQVVIIPNENGKRTTPSYVAFTHTQRLLGDAAFTQAHINAPNTLFNVKRLIGHKFDEISDIDHWPFRVEQGEGEKPRIAVNYKGEERFFSAEEISSMVLIKMKKIAEAFVGSTVKHTVITVPAYFNNLQREATRDAGEIAGLNVIRIINEPTAAAIAYGLVPNRDMSEWRNVLIFDLGGGTLDVSLLRLRKGWYEVIATASNPHLGGEDFDNRLVNHFALKFKCEKNIDIRGHQQPLRLLRTACEKAKKLLSIETWATIEVDSLWEDIDFSSSITRAEFEKLNIDLFKMCLESVKRCLGDVKMEKDCVDDVVLVGGSTRIPRVRKILKEFFNGKELYTGINPDEAVAYGAAVQASIISGADKSGGDFLLLDVVPHSLGVEAMDQIMAVLIQKNSSIPTKVEQVFTTSMKTQEAVEIRVYEGEGLCVKENNFLGSFVLSGILHDVEGMPEITVSFDIDADGILHVTAKDKTSGRQSTITINNNGRLSKEEMSEMAQRAKMFEEDEELKKIHARSDLETFVSNIKKIIQGDDENKLINPDVKKKIEDATMRISVWVAQNKLAGIVELTDKLEELQDICNPIIDRINPEPPPEARGSKSTEELKEQVDAKDKLEEYCKDLKELIGDATISSIFSPDDKKNIEDALETSFQWLEQNKLAETDELKVKLKEVQDICDPIIQRGCGEGY